MASNCTLLQRYTIKDRHRNCELLVVLKEGWISQSLLTDLQPVNQCSLVNTCYDKVLTNELAAPLWLTAPKRFTESLQAAGKSSLSSAPQHKSSSCHTHTQWLQFTLLPAGVTKNILNLQIKELHLVQFSLLRCFRAQIKTVTALLRCR